MGFAKVYVFSDVVLMYLTWLTLTCQVHLSFLVHNDKSLTHLLVFARAYREICLIGCGYGTLAVDGPKNRTQELGVVKKNFI